MPKEGLKSKLTRSEQLQVCVWFAEMHTPSEIVRLIEDNFQKDLDWNSVIHYRQSNRWKKIIGFLRKRILTDLAKIPITDKAVRLHRLENIYHQAMRETLKSIGQYGSVYEFKLGAAIDALVEARKEIEGEKPFLIDQSRHLHLTIEERNARARRLAEKLRKDNLI